MRLSLQTNLCNFILGLTLVLIGTQASANDNFFIDQSIQDGEQIQSRISETNKDVFQLFSHGKPGQLLINGQWLNKEEIKSFLISELRKTNSNVNHINIYGCEFGKGVAGLEAINYLESNLGISISASDDVTGKNGDWELEIGDAQNAISIPSYQYDLQCATGRKYQAYAYWRQAGAACTSTNYVVNHGGTQIVTNIDQTARPNDYVYNGLPFEHIGTGIVPTSTGEFTVRLRAGSSTCTSGNMFADAILIVDDLGNEYIIDNTEGKAVGAWVNENRADNYNGSVQYIPVSAVSGPTYFDWVFKESTQLLDTDLDGIIDACDDDDDNDGILDAEEGLKCGRVDMTDFIGLSTASAQIVTETNPLDGYPAGETVSLKLNNMAALSAFEVKADPAFAIRDITLGGDGNGLYMRGQINNLQKSIATFSFSQPIFNLKFGLSDLDFGNLAGPEILTVNAILSDGSTLDLNTATITEYRFDGPTSSTISGVLNPPGSLSITDNTISGENTAAHQLWAFDFSSCDASIGISKLQFIFAGAQAEDVDMAMTLFDLTYCGGPDSDNDCTPDFLDTDSDNDGCPDSVEGIAYSTDPTANGCNTTTAEDDINQTEIGMPVTGNVLTNDSDAEGNDQDVTLIDTDGDGIPDTAPVAGTPLTITDENGTTLGTLVIDPETGIYTFTPDSKWGGGEVDIAYEVCDDGNPVACDTANLVIDVTNPSTGANIYPPFVVNDESITEPETPVTINVLANDSDPNGDLDPSSVKLIDPVTGLPTTSVTVPGEGTWTVNTDGTVTFVPEAGFTGETTPIEYQVCDKTAPTPLCDTAEIVVTVKESDPTMNTTYVYNNANSGAIDETLMGNILDNAVDLEGDTQSVTLIDTDNDGIPDTAPTGSPQDVTLDGVVVGQITVDPATGDYTWDPISTFEGTVNVAYTVCDNNSTLGSACDSATLVLTELGTNAVPDYTVALLISPTQVNGTSANLKVRVFIRELNGGVSNGTPIYIFIPESSFYTIGDYNSSMTTINGIPVKNSDWSYLGLFNGQYIYEYIGNGGIFNASSSSAFGLEVSFSTKFSTGFEKFPVTIYQGSGGETNTLNNSDVETINYSFN